MLRKRTRSDQKHQMVSGSDSSSGQSEFQRFKNHRNGSFFSIPSLFVGFSKKGSSKKDPARSPTTPLDFRLFPCFGSLLAGSSSKRVHHVHQKSWDSCKVGLSIVDSLEDRTDTSGKVLHSTESKSILFGPGLGNDTHQAIAPKANAFADPPSLNGLPPKQSLERLSERTDPILESEIELSEDYTCVISHGPNPKTTHFYGDQILESVDNNDLKRGFRYKEQKDFTTIPIVVTKPVFPTENFLSFCNSCNKGLEGADIYMYRGHIAFCSEECRLKEVLADEEMDDAAVAAKSVVSDKGCKDPSEKKKKKKKKKNKTSGGVVFTVGRN